MRKARSKLLYVQSITNIEICCPGTCDKVKHLLNDDVRGGLDDLW
jgi:hypothetical protein